MFQLVAHIDIGPASVERLDEPLAFLHIRLGIHDTYHLVLALKLHFLQLVPQLRPALAAVLHGKHLVVEVIERLDILLNSFRTVARETDVIA